MHNTVHVDCKRRESRWLFPPLDWCKDNFDGAAKGNSGLAVCGGVFRDHFGQCLAVVALPLGKQTNHYVEAMAALQATRMAKDTSISNLWLEGNSNNIINCLKEISKPSWTIDNIIQEIESILNTMENYFISHVYRESNKTVDSIANVAVRLNQRMCWQGDIVLPMEVMSSINYDMVNGKEGFISNDVNGTSR